MKKKNIFAILIGLFIILASFAMPNKQNIVSATDNDLSNSEWTFNETLDFEEDFFENTNVELPNSMVVDYSEFEIEFEWNNYTFANFVVGRIHNGGQYLNMMGFFVEGESYFTGYTSSSKMIYDESGMYGGSIGWQVEQKDIYISTGNDIQNAKFINYLTNNAVKNFDDYLSGTTWTFNSDYLSNYLNWDDGVEIFNQPTEEFKINFKSNNNNYDKPIISEAQAVEDPWIIITYASGENENAIYRHQYSLSDINLLSEYGTIEISGGKSCFNVKLYNWLSRNATKITADTPETGIEVPIVLSNLITIISFTLIAVVLNKKEKKI